MSGKSKFQISRSLDERIKRIMRSDITDTDSEFSQVSSAYILGFNYGNITNCVGLTTNYQLHHAVFPVVGLVFFKSSPTDDEIKSSLVSIREFSSSPNGLGSFNPDKNEHLFLIYNIEKETNEIEKRIFNFTKGTFVRRRRSRLSILDDPYCPQQFHRGSEDFFNLNDDDSLASVEEDPVDHLIFFVHGVGGVCDVRFRSCVEVVADFRKMANNLLSQQSSRSSSHQTSRASTPNKQLAKHLRKGFFRKYSTESSMSRESDIVETRSTPSSQKPGRIECLPISWHSCTRKQTGMNEQLSLIALSSVPKLRHFLNKVVMDALLYTSGPVHCQTILNNVGDEINRLYTLFMEKHPNFTGSVSLAGHSLGSVIVFDLLAHQIPIEPPEGGANAHTSSSNQNYKVPAKESSDDSSNNDSVSNNNNNNNNSHDKENGECKHNSRLNCRHISHHHHDLSPNGSENCMDYKNIEELLKDMDLTEFTEVFQKEHVDINALLLLTDLDMKELNLPLGAKRKLGTYINAKKVSMISIGKQLSDDNLQHHENNQQATTSETAKQKKINNCLIDQMNTGQLLVKYPQLKFKPRCFFSFGSPLPMFLNIRGVENISKEYKLPTCDRMLNIFHPYDPLAYRVEPLIDPRFKNVEPVLVPHHRGGKRIHVQIREGFAKVGSDIKHRIFGSIKDTWSSITRFNPSNLDDDDEEEPAPAETSNIVGLDTTKIGSLNGGRRLDYVLQEKPIELFNEYIFAFISHANYWQNEDSAQIILNEIYQVDSGQLMFDFD